MPFPEEHPYLKIIQDISRQKEIRVYLVGGFLRDHFLKRPCLDFDFAVEKNAVAFARAFAKKIQGAFVLLDAEHGCGRVVKKGPGGPQTYDFADFRAPSLPKDLLHRDFTINTLCVDIKDVEPGAELNEILKDHRGGLKDLKARSVRMNSVRTFREDPLRLLRAYSHRAVLGFKIEKKTLAQIKKDVKLIRRVSFERVRDELFKILASPRAAETLKAMDACGLLSEILPQITVMYGVHQGGYHHLDVWPHSLETVRQFEGVLEQMKDDPDVTAYMGECLAGPRPRYALVKLAALLHDIGKPETRKKEVDRISFHGHEHVGRNIARPMAKALKLSTRERYVLEDIIQWHLRPGYLSNFKQPSERSVFRFFRDTKDEAVSVLLMSLADQRSTRGPLTSEADQRHHEKICLGLTRRYFEIKKAKPLVRLIDGHDLIKALKLTPSPLFGKILKEIEEMQATGKVATREDALAAARGIAQNGPKAKKA
ncbi:MAG: HD domain-containing protein [Candidatus Omnitrophota bacterium]|nr:HD domain-containing protein [Candidatus Omnitrophota bacterium]MDZ4241906.1 HD domain-containing protein [Candidatus Omnitrophota bacterium]